jgi:hypothetical protein
MQILIEHDCLSRIRKVLLFAIAIRYHNCTFHIIVSAYS